MATIHCYAQRLLNPFRGVTNIIEYKSAEGVSTDGVQWDIYVRDEELVRDIDNSNRVVISDIRYGRWTEQNGLTRGPLYPSENFRLLERQGATVYEYLLQAHKQIPFAFQDKFEFWLLDKHHRPLALLNSAVKKADMDLHQSVEWRCGQACQQSFESPAMEQVKQKNRPHNAGHYLADYINSLAGEPVSAQWFCRHADGSGQGLGGINLAGSLPGRRLPEESFSMFMVNRHAVDARHQALVDDFIAWQAPWFLLLSGLGHAQREEFEQHARKRALLVDQQYRLYPEIIDAAAIKAARVEAMLRKKQTEKKAPEDVMSTFYIELSPSPTE